MKFGCSLFGISKTISSADRIPDSQPRPAYVRPTTPTIPTAVAALSIEVIEIWPDALATSGEAVVTMPGSTCWMAVIRSFWASG